jgi:hypothetical protein
VSAEKALWLSTLKASRECLELDQGFLSGLDRRSAEGADALEPSLWENFIEARRELVDYTTGNLNLLARDRKSQERNQDINDRLVTTLGEVMRLEEKLAVFLRDNLSALKDTIDGISKNQVIFSAYARNNHKSRRDVLETTL